MAGKHRSHVPGVSTLIKRSLKQTTLRRLAFFKVVTLATLAVSFPVPSYAEEMERDEAGLLRSVEKLEQLARTSKVRTQDKGLETKLQTIACRLAPGDCENLRIYALDLPGFNAFVLPNGAIFIQSGLLLRIQSEAELAAVIAHEIVHYQNSHTLERIRKQSSSAATYAVLGALVGAAGTVAAAGATTPTGYNNAVAATDSAFLMLNMMQGISALAMLDYSRDQEKEADLSGAAMLASEGYDAGAARDLWLSYVEEDKSADRESGMSLLSTHPLPAERITYLSGLDSRDFDSKATPSDTQIMQEISNNRADWLLLEMRVLHPNQFSYLLESQYRLWGLNRKLVNFLKADSWVKYANRRGISKSTAETRLKNAFQLFQDAENGEGLTAAGYRDWGMLAYKQKNNETAVFAFEKYLAAEPEAWDAKMITKRIAKLKR